MTGHRTDHAHDEYPSSEQHNIWKLQSEPTNSRPKIRLAIGGNHIRDTDRPTPPRLPDARAKVYKPRSFMPFCNPIG
jgi:hypothetical protein